MTDAGNAAKRAGVIGLGAMGLQMARHMVAKSFDVAGYDIDVDAMRRASDLGVKTCLSAAQVGDHAEVVIVMVATDRQWKRSSRNRACSIAWTAAVSSASSAPARRRPADAWRRSPPRAASACSIAQ
jgi:3-hydroxyisobutyrate dehydrogenase-like beta-hydroxyacid dehydrogenase